jgi:hypothetical protein
MCNARSDIITLLSSAAKSWLKFYKLSVSVSLVVLFS